MSMQYWLGVVVPAHTEKDGTGGFAQLCHRKYASLSAVDDCVAMQARLDD